MCLMVVIGYQLALTFWTAAFPRLARDTPELQDAAKELRDGNMSEEEYSKADSLQRNRLANVAFYVCSCGEVNLLHCAADKRLLSSRLLSVLFMGLESIPSLPITGHYQWS